MIYVTHDQTEALTFAEKVVVMHDGMVVQIGTPQELFETPAHVFVGYFIGSPGMNFIPVSLDGRKAVAHGETIDLGQDFGQPRGKIVLGVRPEFTRLTKGDGLPVTINHVRDAGRHKFVNAKVFDTEINLVVDAGTEIDVDMTKLAFDQSKVSVFCDDWRIDAAPTDAVSKGAIE